MMRAVHAKLTAKTSETMRARIIALVHATRHLPAPELFSACWRAFLQESVGRCHGKSSTDLSRQGVHPDSQGRKREDVLRSAANHISRLPGYRLGGLLVRNAGHPPRGSGTGSQTLEGFHSFWQTVLTKRARQHPCGTLDMMQTLFTEHWPAKMQDDDAPSPSLWRSPDAGAFLRQWRCPAQGRSEFGRRLLDPSRLRQSLRGRMQRNEVLDNA